MRSKPESERRRPFAFSLHPSTVEKLKDAIGNDMPLSRFVETAILWYAHDLKSDPSKLKAPED